VCPTVLCCFACGGSADCNLCVDLKFAEEQAFVLRKSSIINDLPIPLWSDPEAPSISQSYNMYVCSPCISLTLTPPGNQSPLSLAQIAQSAVWRVPRHTRKWNTAGLWSNRKTSFNTWSRTALYVQLSVFVSPVRDGFSLTWVSHEWFNFLWIATPFEFDLDHTNVSCGNMSSYITLQQLDARGAHSAHTRHVANVIPDLISLSPGGHDNGTANNVERYDLKVLFNGAWRRVRISLVWPQPPFRWNIRHTVLLQLSKQFYLFSPLISLIFIYLLWCIVTYALQLLTLNYLWIHRRRSLACPLALSPTRIMCQ